MIYTAMHLSNGATFRSRILPRHSRASPPPLVSSAPVRKKLRRMNL